MGKNKIVLSVFMVLVVLTASYYIFLPDKVRVDIEDTRNIYSVYIGEEWQKSGTEYIYLFDGTKKMRAKERSKNHTIVGDLVTFEKVAHYKDNITTKEVIIFNSSLGDVQTFPKERIVYCYNCQEKIIHFEYRDILYSGETKDITSPFEFGYNMKLEWQEGNYYAKVKQQKVASDKIIIRYRPEKEEESYRVRLFDPPDIVTLGLPTDNYINDTELQHSLTFNCSTDFNATNLSLYLTNYTNGSFNVNQTSWGNLTNTSMHAKWTVNLHTGDYTWSCAAQNSTGSTIWATSNRSILVNTTGLNHSFQNLTSLGYPVNFSLINWSTIINSTNALSGNYTWNFTQTNITPYNFTDYLFAVENTGYNNITVFLQQNQTEEWYNWRCNDLNITTSNSTLFNLSRGQTDYVNCSLDLFNISQTYVNWTKTVDRASFNFDYIFGFTEVT